LVRATYADAYGLALRLTGDEHDARDAVQEAYVRVLRGIRRFRGEAAFTTWLYRITANCAADLLARRSRVERHELPGFGPDDGAAPTTVADERADHDPVRQSEASDDRRRLLAALANLPERLRLAIVLHDVYDLPHDAIAAELGISVAAAKVRLHRARRRLRDDLFESSPRRGAPERPGSRPAACHGKPGPAADGGPTREAVRAAG
jgi:RNA polymerase sigma-70 factor (ECF subfamily)